MKTLPGSIFGKRLEVVEEADDLMDTVVICPYCGEKVKYGDTMMISGIVNCPKCNEKCVKEVLNDKEHNYDRYRTHDYQPFGIKESK